MSIIGLTSSGGHKKIMAIGSYAMSEEEGRAEVALMIREDFQGQGIGSYLVRVLQRIASENNYRGFIATVLEENSGMIHVFKKLYPHCKMENIGNEILIDMDFEDSAF
jgi:RimJ/RimL family protein N-acetyltransferase